MSLIGALNSSKSALAVHQAAIQVTSNNVSNAGNENYTRQVARTSPRTDQHIRSGVFVGTGVSLDAIERQIDDALEGRLRGSVSDSESAGSLKQWLSQVEAVFNELGEDDLSTRLSAFFGSWSNLANKPQDIGLRQVVIQNGDGLARWFNALRRQFGALQTAIDERMPAVVKDADALARKIADINGQIVTAEGGADAAANGLRDQRDALIKQLSELVDVKTVAKEPGVIDVYIGSAPLVVGTMNRGLAVRQDQTPAGPISTVVFKADKGAVNVASGQLGGLVQARAKVDGTIEKVDELATNLVFELNKLHSAGQGLEGFSDVTATTTVLDTTVALTDPRAGLTNMPANGSFVVHVKDKATGLATSTLIQVDLDGLNGNDATLESLRAQLDGVAGVAATASAGRLGVSAESNAVEISFSQDSSGVLAALGVNTFFTGRDARDMAMNEVLQDRPALLAAARNGEKGDNQTARAIAALETQAIAALGGTSLKDAYAETVTGVAVAVSAAETDAEAATAVRETLQAQREALSGVSLDEEAVNLMRQQRAFQGAARVITAVNDMMGTVLSMLR